MENSLHLLPLLMLCLCLVLLQHTCSALLVLSDVQEGPRGDAHEQHPRLGRPRTMIFHPPTGLCVLRNRLTDPLKLGSCAKSDSWYYTPQKFLTVKGTYFCLQAVGEGKQVKLSIICTPSDSQWEVISSSEKTHLATKLANGRTVCLDIDASNAVVSNPCGGNGEGDSQWFKIVTGKWGSLAMYKLQQK